MANRLAQGKERVLKHSSQLLDGAGKRGYKAMVVRWLQMFSGTAI